MLRYHGAGLQSTSLGRLGSSAASSFGPTRRKYGQWDSWSQSLPSLPSLPSLATGSMKMMKASSNLQKMMKHANQPLGNREDQVLSTSVIGSQNGLKIRRYRQFGTEGYTIEDGRIL